MRNPIRLKNLSLRFAPYYAAGIALLLLTDAGGPGAWLGIVPVVTGLVLRTWAAGHLVKNDRFAVTGAYAHLRHPLYLGTLLVAAGLALMLGGWASLVVLAFVLAWFFLHYFPRKERVEAERLVARYGDVYGRYRDQVPALLPRLRVWHPDPPDAEKVETDLRWSFECYDANNELGTLVAVAVAVCLLAWRASLG